jgi:hypothetical protein
LQVHEGASAGVGNAGGGVQQAVAQPFGFGAGELAVQGERLGPGQQVQRDQGQL